MPIKQFSVYVWKKVAEGSGKISFSSSSPCSRLTFLPSSRLSDHREKDGWALPRTQRVFPFAIFLFSANLAFRPPLLKVIHKRQNYYPSWTHYVYWILIPVPYALASSCSVKLPIIHWETFFQFNLHVTYAVQGFMCNYYDFGCNCQKENGLLWPDVLGLNYCSDRSLWALQYNASFFSEDYHSMTLLSHLITSSFTASYLTKPLSSYSKARQGIC